jgi:hypothetical protein
MAPEEGCAEGRLGTTGLKPRQSDVTDDALQIAFIRKAGQIAAHAEASLEQ